MYVVHMCVHEPEVSYLGVLLTLFFPIAWS